MPVKKPFPWVLLIGGSLIGGAIYHYQADREASARGALLKQAVFLAETDKSRVVGVHLSADGQWQVLPFVDAGAAFRWFGEVTHGGYRPDSGTFTVWVDKAEDNWRATAPAHATYGRGR
jgi:hypothetical protein